MVLEEKRKRKNRNQTGWILIYIGKSKSPGHNNKEISYMNNSKASNFKSSFCPIYEEYGHTTLAISILIWSIKKKKSKVIIKVMNSKKNKKKHQSNNKKFQ